LATNASDGEWGQSSSGLPKIGTIDAITCTTTFDLEAPDAEAEGDRIVP
jgi:hypothetical protein